MNISGPERYKLSFNSDSFKVFCQKGTSKFSGIATSTKPKLYIVSVDAKPIYVSVTKQSLRKRLCALAGTQMARAATTVTRGGITLMKRT
jgi:hypothetical protein